MTRKMLLPLLLLMLSTPTLRAQLPFYDALELAKLNPVLDDKGKCFFPIAAKDQAAKILQKYSKTSTYGALQDEFDKNPFIGLPEVAAAASVPTTAAGDVLGSIAGFNVGVIADGMARFIVRRTKQELNAAFFQKFADLIKKPEYQDAQTLFPQTYLTLLSIGNQIYNYELYLTSLREAFEMDLNGMMINLERLVQSDRYKEFFDAHRELKAICLSSIYVGKQLQKGVHAGVILADFPVDALFDPAYEPFRNVNGAAKTLQLVSTSLRSKSSDRYWVDADSMRLMFNSHNKIALRIYLGLLYHQAENITFRLKKNGSTQDKSLQTAMREMYTDANNTARFLGATEIYIKEFASHATSVMQVVRKLAATDQADRRFIDYYDVFNASINLLEHASALHTVPGFEGVKPSEALLEQIFTARSGATIAMDISRRQYASAVMKLNRVFTFFLKNEATGAVSQFIVRYGSFMAAVAQADSSEQVAQAIENIALPSGSSRIKRESAFNVSLNSYAGLFAGYEKIEGIDDAFEVNAYGVTAPVGIAISRGHSILFLGTGKTNWREGKRGWSSSLFLSVIDIGALAAFRAVDDSTGSVPDIELKNIISPGVFYSLGIPKSPLSINIGWQAGPLLRTVTKDQNDYSESYSRFSLSLCVDIPILNFYVASKEWE